MNKIDAADGRETIGTSDVETPRSESETKMVDPAPGSEEEKDKPKTEDVEKEKDPAKETYGVEAMKFGVSSIRGAKGSASPMLGGERGF